MKRGDPREIACQQVLVAESSVLSVQWMTLSSAEGSRVSPRVLLDRYLRYLRRVTLSLVRPVTTDGGIEFRLFPTRLSLLSFSSPRPAAKGTGISLPIRGGLLVEPDCRRRGEFSFLVEPAAAGMRIMVKLTDYCPILLGERPPSSFRRWVYRNTQARIHKKVTIAFLARICRELAGKDVCVAVVDVVHPSAKEI